jgi:hypothetical protein
MFAKSAILAVLAVVINASCAEGEELVVYDETDSRCELECPDNQPRDPMTKLCGRARPRRPTPPPVTPIP